ncbi:MAG: L-threonine 3-dehydrogenase [Flavobacteriaceae bacterium]|jgi:threonine 3-dehydrogenase|nr:L-threonine 3-dehydrogenase [Flavobacteriaceae bacterium]|tara:strand:- start:7797 stop:8822 length:1026 start_codon:yes stop_codon:yes gene_type:complete
MKALVKEKSEVGLKLQEVKTPKIKSDEVLIKVKTTAICGTDLHIWNWDNWASKTIKPPMTVGHEFMGKIIEIGSAVEGLTIGDRVSAESHMVGQVSRNARAGKLHLDPDTVNLGVDRDGAFAEFVSIPSRNVVQLPDSVDNEMGAILDPFGNAIHATLSFDLVGEDVLITGAGPIGIMSAAIALHVGARKVLITDINDDRLSLAKTVCNVETLNPSKENIEDKMKDMGLKEGFDIGLEMSGSEAALDQMIDSMLMGGNIALLGLPSDPINLDLSKIIFKALNLKAIYGREMFETWYKGLALIDSGLDVKNVITHSFHYTDFEKAFQLLNEGKAGKVVLNWD